jgi:hypothetical protein
MMVEISKLHINENIVIFFFFKRQVNHNFAFWIIESGYWYLSFWTAQAVRPKFSLAALGPNSKRPTQWFLDVAKVRKALRHPKIPNLDLFELLKS